MLTKSIALRLVIGSCVIWLVLTVVEIVGACVCTISDDETTVTCSVTPPTSSTARTLAPAPEVRTTSLTMNVLKPERETVTV